MQTDLDLSDQGRLKTAAYISGLIAAVEAYQNLLGAFFEEHEQAMKNPKLLDNVQWYGTCIMTLGCMSAIWTGGFPDKYPKEIIRNPPDGCYGIEFGVRNLAAATEKLSADYQKFIQHKQRRDLEKSNESANDISERLVILLRDIDAVAQQIAP